MRLMIAVIRRYQLKLWRFMIPELVRANSNRQHRYIRLACHDIRKCIGWSKRIVYFLFLLPVIVWLLPMLILRLSWIVYVLLALPCFFLGKPLAYLICSKRIRHAVWRRLDMHGVPTCPHCGYDRRQSAGHICPECGRRRVRDSQRAT